MASDSDSGKAPDKGKGVFIQSFPDRLAADLAAARLEANGIACWVAADDAGGFYPNLALSQGVRLFVAESQAEAARELLSLPPSPVDPGFGAEKTPAATTDARPKKLARAQIIAGIIVGVLGTLLYQHFEPRGTHTYYGYTAQGKIGDEWIYVDGNLREHLEDRNHDGKFDLWSYYDLHGLQRSDHDNNFDGKPDEWWFYTNGDVLTMEKDCDFNGVPDEFYTYTNDIPRQLDIRPNGSTYTTVREVYMDGVLSEIWRGGDSNGHFKEVVRYDPFFEPVSTNSDAFPVATGH